MYARILMRDLRRRKSTNVILLLFIILAAMFISSSLANIVAIPSARDSYFDRAGLEDFYIMTLNDAEGDRRIMSFLDKEPSVDSYKAEDYLTASSDSFIKEDGESLSFNNASLVVDVESASQRFFDEKDEVISRLGDDEICLPMLMMDGENIKPGDVITLKGEAGELPLRVKCGVKDALLGSEMMGAERFLISPAAYAKLEKLFSMSGKLFSVDANDITKLKSAYSELGANEIFSGDRDMVAMVYILDQVVTAVLLVASIVLIAISLVILRFTIVFTLTEEYREIGVMKAIGIGSGRIRGLYMVKYLALALVGSAVGYAAGVPFGTLMLQKSARNMVMSGAANTRWVGIAGAVLIVVIVLLFCFGSTRRVKRYSPLDAIRSGSSGERFSRKSALRLSKSRLSSVPFMSLNDILSGVKRFTALLITFTLGTLLMILPLNTSTTLNSPELTKLMSMSSRWELQITDMKKITELIVQERGAIYDYLDDVSRIIEAEGWQAEVGYEAMFSAKLTFGDTHGTTTAIQGTGNPMSSYSFTSGTAPRAKDEIAVTHLTAAELGIGVGDTIEVAIGGQSGEYLVTAIYQTMMNMGKQIRFFEDCDSFPYSCASGSLGVQIHFLDKPDSRELERRAERLRELFPDADVNDRAGFVSSLLGGTLETVNSLSSLILVLVLLVDALIAVLMTKSFIVKERNQIAMLKSLGFTNRALRLWQTLRIGLVMLAASLLGAMLSAPAGQLLIAPIFKMMGASSITLTGNPLWSYLICPAAVLAVTMIACTLSALQINRIETREVSTVE